MAHPHDGRAARGAGEGEGMMARDVQQLAGLLLFTACGFSPLVQKRVSRSTVVLISLLYCLWSGGRTSGHPKAFCSSRENRLHKHRAQAALPHGSFSSATVHGHSSSGQVKASRMHRRRRHRKNAPREGGGFCCNLILRGAKPCWTK